MFTVYTSRPPPCQARSLYPAVPKTAYLHARIVAAVEEPYVIRKLLDHFEKHGALPQAHYQPEPRGPPRAVAA